jgi:sugar transferase (PEP-CTERM/EpsH1 system associated)
MRILCLSQRVPYPPNRGDKIITYHWIRHLAQNHEVHVACLADGKDDLANVAGLDGLAASVDAVPLSRWRSKLRALAALATGTPLTVAIFNEPKLRRRVRACMASGIDAVFVFSSGMASFVEDYADLPRIIHFADLDSLKWQRWSEMGSPPLSWIYGLEAGRLLRYERHLAHSYDCSVVCSARELDDLRRLMPGAPARCVRNGVDLDYFAPMPVEKQRHSLVFTGVMNYFPNVDAVGWFCQEILPLVRAEVPDVTFTICGARPDRKVLALQELPGVTVTGAVPDVRPYLARASASVQPLRAARGIQNKLLEAMAMGLPVVATSTVFNGIEATAGADLLVADEPREFAAHVTRLLGDDGLRERIGQAARAIVERNYRWENALLQLDEMCAAIKAKVG